MARPARAVRTERMRRSYAEFETGRHCALGCIEQALRCPHEGILECPNFATVFAAGSHSSTGRWTGQARSKCKCAPCVR